MRAATAPRLIGIFLILVVGAAVCLRLGMWQLDRAQIRGEQEAAVEQAARESAAPVPLDSVIGPQTQLTQEMVGTRVSLQGVFEKREQFYVVAQVHDGHVGYFVLNGLTLTAGEHAGAVVPVVRGWVPEPDPAYVQTLPDAEQEVTVMGYLSPSQAAGARLPEPELMESVSSAQLVNVWGGPIYSAHIRMAEPEPAALPAEAQVPQIEPVGAPPIEGGGLNLQNLAYAGEWWIFGVFALFLWWRMVRDEVHHQRAAAAEAAEPANASEEPEPDGESDGPELVDVPDRPELVDVQDGPEGELDGPQGEPDGPQRQTPSAAYQLHLPR